MPNDETTLCPPSKLKNAQPLEAYVEELCWRTCVGELLNMWRVLQKTPGPIGEAIRQLLISRLLALMETRALFHVAEDKQIQRFAKRMLKKAEEDAGNRKHQTEKTEA